MRSRHKPWLACGLGTAPPNRAWVKFETLVEGASIAPQVLWGQAGRLSVIAQELPGAIDDELR